MSESINLDSHDELFALLNGSGSKVSKKNRKIEVEKVLKAGLDSFENNRYRFNGNNNSSATVEEILTELGKADQFNVKYVSPKATNKPEYVGTWLFA